MTADHAFAWVLRLCAVSVGIGTLELLARLRLFGTDGCLAWSVIGESHGFDLPEWVEAMLGRAGVGCLLLLRLAAAGALLSPLPASMLTPCLVTLAVATLILGFRMPVGRDGADQMNDLILIPSALAMLSGWEHAKVAALCFIAAQSSLSYVTAGIAKLASPVWRSGAAIPQILSTLGHGDRFAVRALGSNRLSLALCWSVILFETTFPLWLLAGPRAAVVTLGAGAIFHISCAVFMGLNTFVWSFVAAYPAIWVVSTWAVGA